MIILKIEIEEKIMKGKLNKRIAVIIITIFILAMVLYNLQFKIFSNLYNKKNKLAEIIYQINKNNSKFSMEVNDLFEEQLRSIIEEYKRNEISSEELENKANEFSQYKDSSSEISEIKDHPFMIGVQFHPELKSRITNPHPIFVGFIEAAKKFKNK